MHKNATLELFQKYLKQAHLDALYIPKNDRFMNEYVEDQDDVLKFVSGFSGSFGYSFVTKKRGYLFVDRRYTLQAKKETDPNFWHILTHGQDSLSDFFKDTEIQTVGFDPYLITVDVYKKWVRHFENIIFKPLQKEWLVPLWNNRPSFPCGKKIFHHKIEFSGLSAFEKVKSMALKIEHPYLIHQLDNLCWLLNLRGEDIPFTPLFVGVGILYPDATVDVFTRNQTISEEALSDLKDFVRFYNLDDLLGCIKQKEALFIHEESTPYALTIDSKNLIGCADFITPMKAQKNKIEQSGMKDCHMQDAIAVLETLYWVDTQKEYLTECAVSDYLEEQRKKRLNFASLSFGTISASGPNGAIIHYHPSHLTNRSLKDDSIFLLDSGGQYFNGTTDITRTVCIGTPTNEQISRYTDVLKGHIALSSIKFPKGTRGSQLDVLARQYLWKNGLDYQHGTGHGVGCFLNVHEKPQSISKYGNAILKEGMVISNEPGFYKQDSFGIRLENLELIKESSFPDFLEFETLTLVPFDKRLIDFNALTYDEIEWLRNYYKRIKKMVIPYLTPDCKNWTLLHVCI
ncbi:MAG: hypothetical protein HEEMFOPI_00836 [Holosporales bacterium]